MLFRYKQGLVDLFRRVHELRDDPVRKRLLALEIQEDLLRRIGHAEQRLRRTRFTNNALKCQLAKRAIDYQTVREIQTRYAAGEKKIGQQKELILTLRAVGDSIAFIYADRWDLKQFVWHEDSGFITGKRGTRLERQVLRRAFGIGAAAVLNDLTHTLRHGDITVFRDDGKFLVVELKSGRGGNRSRTERQLRASKRIMDYLSTDVREEEDGIWLRVDLAEAPLHHCVAITRLITTLPRAGWLVEEVEPGLHYVVVDCARGESHLDEVFQPLQSKERFLVAWCVNEIKRCQLAYYPFPLCINDAEALFRFYNGEFVAFVFVDVNYVNSALAHRSLSIKMTEKDEYPWEVVPTASHVGWGEGPLYLSWHILSRLAGEFLRLDWFLENVVANNAKASVTYARDLAARIATHH